MSAHKSTPKSTYEAVVQSELTAERLLTATLRTEIARLTTASIIHDGDMMRSSDQHDRILAERDTAIAERDLARDLCREVCDFTLRTSVPMPPQSESALVPRLTVIRGVVVQERVAEIRRAIDPLTPTKAQLCDHVQAYACHECEASRCVACDVKVASRSDHAKLFRVCPRCL